MPELVMLYPLLEGMLTEYGEIMIIKVAVNSGGGGRGKEGVPG